MTGAIYDWRTLVAPINQLFRAGDQPISGGMVAGGASYINPEPGGRGELFMEFHPLASIEANRQASWTISRALGGAIFRVPIYDSVQLVGATDLGGPTGGLMWSNGQPWSNGQGWRYDPQAPVTVAALAGTTEVQVDLSGFGEVLNLGHVIGFGDVTHIVENIDYDDSTVATIEISPPLRADLTTSDELRFRPVMLATISNAREFANTFTSGRHVRLGSTRFVEYFA